MDINVVVCKVFINVDGIIEKNFILGKYILEMSLVVYKLDWWFDE